MDVSTIPSRIRLARANCGLSQTEMARRLGVNRATVAHWEREEGFTPTIEHLHRMSGVLGVAFAWLAQGETPPAEPAVRGSRARLEEKMIELSKHLPVSFLASVVALMENAETYL
ncbi:XRE family transcriptional regulator [Stenotrophomonas maltophilia]|uniref:helix-turn-helix domain-containing protein n=1 Tax=Stenotrophomonas TaxID=40323 RepID=UPI000777DB03|nr:MULTISPECIES: helix-turn-helix transcriptional regulator [Stenotrophomonas]KXU93833.1 hypothetical protein AB839_15585 [Stenotrophomonas sp. DDT-1]MBA0388119.1 XRE family transcriptional regulator [Stenotrophomonas maltophilia]MBA0392974.1 XRE family transcriptional regulator [Stenotrophomonas maltophilia]MBA0465885.1 XRE family transcriptional regulator [Stenotrophomonas maltophilia]MBA0472978.1 XRE family transcriptional regulator [Stenotrophomonas maltophilia]